MAYTKSTDFAIKDNLLSGNPSKLVRGSEIDAEFDALEVEDALNLKSATAATTYVTKVQEQNGTHVTLGSVSGTDTITASASPALTSYVAGQTFRFISAGVNTGPVTININGLGAKSITKSGTTALTINDIPAGAVVQITYDGTRFQLSSVASSGSGGATGAGNNRIFVQNDRYMTSSYCIGDDVQVSCAISYSSPAVVTQSNSYVGGEEVFFKTTGTLPTNLSPYVTYYVSSTGLTSSSFQVSATRGGASINTAAVGSGTHTCGIAKSASTVGPLTVASGAVLTIPTGQRLVVL